MVQKINALGFPIDCSRVVALSAGGSRRTAHLADALIEKGFVKSRQEAFDRFLKRDGPAYVPSEVPRRRRRLNSSVPRAGCRCWRTLPTIRRRNSLKPLVDLG